jgi:hypothetical protein
VSVALESITFALRSLGIRPGAANTNPAISPAATVAQTKLVGGVARTSSAFRAARPQTPQVFT